MVPRYAHSASRVSCLPGEGHVIVVGITAIELAEGSPPNASLHPMRAIFLIPTLPPPMLKEQDNWSQDFRDFVRRCLIKEVHRLTRPLFAPVHPPTSVNFVAPVTLPTRVKWLCQMAESNGLSNGSAT